MEPYKYRCEYQTETSINVRLSNRHELLLVLQYGDTPAPAQRLRPCPRMSKSGTQARMKVWHKLTS